MTNDELMTNVKYKLPTRRAITAYWVQQRYHVLAMQARVAQSGSAARPGAVPDVRS